MSLSCVAASVLFLQVRTLLKTVNDLAGHHVEWKHTGKDTARVTESGHRTEDGGARREERGGRNDRDRDRDRDRDTATA